LILLLRIASRLKVLQGLGTPVNLGCMQQDEQQFLNGLDRKLWNAANRLRSSTDAAEYKRVILGLIFLN